LRLILLKTKMKKIFEKIDKKILAFLLILMIFSGVVRGYNFKEWLLVRADQIRDSETAREVLDNGIGHLRLLGPKISNAALPGEEGKGATFNMGPYYYYSQAFSMSLFGNPSPWTIAVPDFVSSLLAIPIFYLVVSMFFSRRTSVLTTILFSFSFLILQYSRFSWNPNQLIFWQLFFIYSVLKFAENKKGKGWWFVSSILGLLVISQLHFLAIVATSLVFLIFFVYQRGWQKLKPKYYLMALGLILIFNFPIIISDIKNDGDNFRRMLVGVSQQSSDSSFFENFITTVEKSSEFYLYFPLSISEDELSQIKPISIFYLISSLAFLSLIFQKRKKINFLRNIEPKNKRALALLVLLYFGFYFLATTGMADRLEKPRYWLSIAPVSFLVVAFWLEWLGSFSKKKIGLVLVLGIFGFMLFQNLYSTYYFYSALKEGEKPELPYKDPISRPHRNLITFGSINRVTDKMSEIARKEKTNICYLSKDYQTKNAYKYIVENYYSDLMIKRLDLDTESSGDCVMFYISEYGDSAKKLKEKFPDRLEFDRIGKDGAIALWRLNVKEEKDREVQRISIFEEVPEKEDKVRLWKEVFEQQK